MQLRPELKTVWTNPFHFMACGFGFGMVPIAPGTWGTLPGVLLAVVLAPLSLAVHVSVLAVLFIAGVALCESAGRAFAQADHPAIVWDEIVGFAIAMLTAPAGGLWLLLAFVLFRIFDIFKPWPINLIDRASKGGLGVMLDDVLAGVYTLIVIQCLASTGLPLGQFSNYLSVN